MTDVAAPDAPTPTPPVLSVRAPTRANGRWTVARPDDGRSEQVNPDDGEQVRKAARALGATEGEVRQALLGARARVLPPLSETSADEPVTVTGRNLDGGSVAPAAFGGLDEALASSPHLYWSWDGTRRLAALDVDVLDGMGVFTDSDVAYVSSAAAPTPSWAWVTRSGGLRLMFEPCARYGLAADERAGLHAILVPRSSFSVRTEKVELLPSTRRPPATSTVTRGAPDYGVSNMRGALMRSGGRDAAPPAEVDTWLADRDMVMGGRYEHERCPIDPGPTSGTPPVMVTDDGVRCFRCAGSRNDGWRSWAALVGAVTARRADPEPYVAAAGAFVHWTHARLVLLALRPRCTEATLRLGYRALLRVLHDATWAEDSERAASVFSPELAIVRGRGSWLHTGSYAVHDAIGPHTLRALPACRGGPALERFQTSELLAGYAPVEPVAHVVDRPTWREGSVLVPRAIPGAQADERLSFAEARERLRRAMGAGCTDDWLDTVYLLVVAGLRAQLRLAVPPVVVLTGATRSGKGAATEAARGILGLPCARLRFDGARELAMSIGEGLDAGAGLLWADEIGKVVDWWHQSTALLQLSDSHTWRKLHHGTTVSPVRAAVLLVGSTLPRGLSTMSEVASRATVVRLPRVAGAVSARWEANLARALGVDGGLGNLRSSPAGAAIAEAWVADAIAEATGERSRVSWPEHGDWLGGSRLGEDADARELADVVAGLYRLWREAPDEALIAEGSRGAGWLRCWAAGRGDQAAELLSEWVSDDDGERERAGRLARLDSVVVPDAARLPPGADVSLVVRSRGRRVSARFSAAGDPASLDRQNPTLFPPSLPPTRA